MDSGHYVEKCKHGIILSQCRCPGPRTEYIIECPAECDAMNLRAQLANRDAEIERLSIENEKWRLCREFIPSEKQEMSAEIERLRAELALRKNYADQCRAQDATIHRLKLELDACERAVREARDGE